MGKKKIIKHTVDSNKCTEVLHSQKRMGQLPDKQLQKARSIVLFQLLPWKHPIIEWGLELLAQWLEFGHKKSCHTSSTTFLKITSTLQTWVWWWEKYNCHSIPLTKWQLGITERFDVLQLHEHEIILALLFLTLILVAAPGIRSSPSVSNPSSSIWLISYE